MFHTDVNRWSIPTTVVWAVAFLSVTSVFAHKSHPKVNSNSNSTLKSTDLGLDESVREKLFDLRRRGLEWLKSRRTEEFGWEAGDTPRAVLALASSLDTWPSPNDLEAKLTIKQLEIELLDKLLRHNVDPISPARVAIFSLALSGACKDPRNFYGHNLIASLEKHQADQDYPGYPEGFGFSLTALVSCTSGSHFHKKQLRHLLRIAQEESFIDSIDTKSMAILALECFRRKKQSNTLAKRMVESLETVSKLQKPDGSFGNIHTTTIAIQALSLTSEIIGNGSNVNLSWNRTAAALAMVMMQRPDGSFLDNTQATGEALIAASTLLNGQGLFNLKSDRCTEREYKNMASSAIKSPILRASAPNFNGNTNTNTNTKGVGEEITSNAILKETPGSDFGSETDATQPIATVKYWLWIGPDPLTAEKHNITLQVPVNTTFINVMRKAAEEDSSYEFSSTVWPNGHYVHTISGHREQPIGFHYWLLYRLPEDPDPLNPPPTTFVAPAGVDDLRVQDGEVYFFWYKKL